MSRWFGFVYVSITSNTTVMDVITTQSGLPYSNLDQICQLV